MNDMTRYSIQIISERKNEKKAELKASKERIRGLAHDLFSPPETKNKMNLLMNHVNAATAAYYGIKTGVKICRRIKETLYGKKHKILP